MRRRATSLRGAHRLVNHRALAGLEFEGKPHALEGKQQVGKNDGRIDTELFRGGDGDFRGQLGLLADFKQGMVAADGLVLRHVAAGLAQEPDGRAVDRPAQAGAQKAGAAGERLTACFNGQESRTRRQV